MLVRSVLAAFFVLLMIAPPASALPLERITNTKADEQRPAITEGSIAWQRRGTGKRPRYDVMLRADGGGIRRVNPKNKQGFMGDFDGTTLVYQEAGRDSNIKTFDIVTGARGSYGKPVNTKHWEFWPTRSGDWLMFGRQHIRTARYQLLLHNASTGELRQLTTLGPKGYLDPGQVSGDWAAWTRCGPGFRCRSFVLQISTGQVTMIPRGAPAQFAAGVDANGTVYYGNSGRGCGIKSRLMRYRQDGTVKQLTKFSKGRDFGSARVHTDAAGMNHVVIDLGRCDPAASEIYRFVDDPTT